MREENYESDLQSHLEPGEALLCSGFRNCRQQWKKWGGWLLKKEPAFPCISVRPCSYRMPDAGGGGSEYTVWSGCFRYRR